MPPVPRDLLVREIAEVSSTLAAEPGLTAEELAQRLGWHRRRVLRVLGATEGVVVRAERHRAVPPRPARWYARLVLTAAPGDAQPSSGGTT